MPHDSESMQGESHTLQALYEPVVPIVAYSWPTLSFGQEEGARVVGRRG
jgi:hypothetical protein